VSFGVMGGPNQPQAHVQVMLNLVVFGMDVQAALDAPRFRHVGEQRVYFDRRTNPATIANLLARGHEVEPPLKLSDAALFGTGHVIRRLGRGYEAGSDSRTDGLPAGH
jgi:gamma-glutamyltranspeptidase/glutathione hydrolase